jgi:large subunit ribosomal protein L24
MKIKNGDTVRIIAGNEKGKSGKVMQTFPEKSLIVVEGVNERTKHLKAQGGRSGEKVKFNAPIHASNVRVVGKKVEGRIGYSITEKDGKKVKTRIVKSSKGQENLA